MSWRARSGAIGESIAAAYLELGGYDVIDRNVRRPGGEIDLIATRQGLTCFVEVRLRRSSRFGTAVDTVDRQKQLRLRRAAAQYMAEAGRTRVRFDVVAIDWQPGEGLRVAHWKDAFR